MPKTWFQFTNSSEKEAEVSIYDAIGLWGVSSKSFIDELKKHAGKKLTVRINSPGGVVTEGFAIFNALKRHKGGVIVQIDALAASMATYIALVGAPIRMAENAFFMIHNVSGVAIGTAEEIRRYADMAEKMEKNIVAAYVARTGKTEEEIKEKMEDETWFTAEEAKDFGFVDEVTDPIEAAACLSDEARELFSKFRNAPAGLVDNATGSPSAHTATTPMKLLTASLAALLNTFSGTTVTETSTEADIKAAFDAVNGKISGLETEKKTLGDKVTVLEGEKTQLTTDLTTAKGEVTTLQNAAKTAEQRAQEIAAAHGSQGAAKGKEQAAAAGGQPDGKAHYDKYQAAMEKADGGEATRIWTAHQKEIEAYVATL